MPYFRKGGCFPFHGRLRDGIHTLTLFLLPEREIAKLVVKSHDGKLCVAPRNIIILRCVEKRERTHDTERFPYRKIERIRFHNAKHGHEQINTRTNQVELEPTCWGLHCPEVSSLAYTSTIEREGLTR